MEIIAHLLEHAFEDTIYLVPFLLVTYLALEVLEHKAGDKATVLVKKAGVAGPLVGALLGAVPQCGFSAAGSALFASRAITLGTLFAVFLSTSDEMLPLFIAEQINPSIVLSIIATKIIIGMIMGFVIDGALRFKIHTRLSHERALMQSEDQHDPCPANDKTDHDLEHTCEHGDHHHVHMHERTCEHHLTIGEELEQPFSPHHCQNPSCSVSENSGSHWKDIALSAVKHTIQVSIIVFLISLILVTIMELAGEEVITNLLIDNPGVAILGSALVGLIPNCGASVVITQLYLDGMLGTGAMISGLLVSAGVGLLVLFSENRKLKQNLLILAILLCIGIAWGFFFELTGIRFL